MIGTTSYSWIHQTETRQEQTLRTLAAAASRCPAAPISPSVYAGVGPAPAVTREPEVIP